MTKEVDHPAHYQTRGIECIDVAEHFSGNIFNCLKYVWRAGEKNNYIEDLKKARWYALREASRMSGRSPIDPKHTVYPREAIPTARFTIENPELRHAMLRVRCDDGHLGQLLRNVLDAMLIVVSDKTLTKIAEHIEHEIMRSTREDDDDVPEGGGYRG